MLPHRKTLALNPTPCISDQQRRQASSIAMPYIHFYADQKDFEMIQNWFNTDSEIAFIVPAGPHRWRAEPKVTTLAAESIALWHVPSGPLPLLHPPPSNKETPIPDPWHG